jgi:hypothetical protein
MFRVLRSIDEMVKSDSPMEVYKEYLDLYLKLSNPNEENKEVTKTNNFF